MGISSNRIEKSIEKHNYFLAKKAWFEDKMLFLD